MKTILIIDYEAGNLHSVVNAFQSQARNTKVVVSGNVADFKKADKIVLPGVGSFRHCALALEAKNGLKDAILEKIAKKTPTLGICVGMQLLFKQSVEGRETPGFAIFNQSIQSFKEQSQCQHLKVPHMGWNQIHFKTNHPLFKKLQSGSYVYFANSFFAPKMKYAIATTNYGIDFSAVVAKENVMGVQFHPEKSQKVGLRIINNFLNL